MGETGDHGGAFDPLIGTIFDSRYRVLDEIGSGGMGTVYKAEQLSMGRMVALKVLRTALVGDRKREGRFLREARAAGKLEHPNILRLYDFGKSDDGRVYLASELLVGESVGEHLRQRGRFEPAEAARIVMEILDAIVEAHRAGLVHRDLKPDNIFLVPPRTGGPPAVKVLDFGLVKFVNGTDSLGHLTRTGVVGGTPAYMSPENAQGDELDGRSDVYSLGVLFYEMLSGRRPFRAPDTVGVLLKHINEAPPPLIVPGLRFSDDVLDVVYRCLEKDPDARFESAEAMLARMRGIASWTAPMSQSSLAPLGAGSLSSQAAMTFSPELPRIKRPTGGGLRPVGAAAPRSVVGENRTVMMTPDELTTSEIPAPSEMDAPSDGGPLPSRPTDNTVMLTAPEPALLERPRLRPAGPGREAVVVFGLLATVVILGGLIAAWAFGFLRF